MVFVKGPRCHSDRPNIAGSGNPDYGVIFCGIAPAENELKDDMPFTGVSGQLLDSLIESVGWSRDKSYYTNLICWWNNSPTDKDIKACAPRLLDELASFKPKLIIPVGSIPSQVFVGREVTKARGIPVWNEQLNCYIMPMFHPSYYLRGAWDSVYDMIRDLKKIPAILAWPQDGTANSIVEYVVVHNVQLAQEVLDSLPPNGIVSLDIETNYGQEDIDVFSEDLLCFSLSWNDVKGVERTRVFANEVCKQPLKWPTNVRWLFQNGFFDRNGLRRYIGIELPICEDTLLQSYLRDERAGIHKLEVQSPEFLGAKPHKEEVRKQKKKTGKVDLDVLYKMNAHDTAYTLRLNKLHAKVLTEDGQDILYRNYSIPAANAFSDISYRGVYVDLGAMRELGIEWFPQWIESSEKLIQLAEEEGFPGKINLKSPQQMARFLFEILGLPKQKLTEKGAPSTDADVIEALAGKHPFVDNLTEFRQLDHMIGTYIIGLQDDLKLDGRVHPEVLQQGTQTGRRSWRKPPLQTIPKEAREGHVPLIKIRKIFAATNDDYILLECDYKQIELWIAYFLSGDPVMLEALMSGDFHGEAAKYMYSTTPCAQHGTDEIPGCVTCGMWHFARTNAKRVTFGIMYDRTEYGLSKGPSRIADTPQAAKPYLDRWRQKFNVFDKWSIDVKEKAKEDGEIVLPTGRKRRFPLIIPQNEKEILRQVVNAPIQGTAGEYILDSIIKLHEAIKSLDSHILLEVHDSLIFEIHRKHFDEAAGITREIMEEPKFGLPSVKIDMKAGPNWLQMTKV